MASEGQEVKVYIYDMSKGLAKAMSQAFLGKRLEGIWHTGIVVYGQEFYFGGTGGIECCPPCGTVLGQPDVKHTVGHTEIPYEIFIDYLMDLSRTTYRPVDYHILDHNCNTFSSELARFLTGNDIPSYVTGLPAEVMSTPFGQMIRPFIDSMSVQPTGGHSLFPGASSNPGAPPGTSQTQQSSSQPAKASNKAKAEKQIPYTFKQSVASEAMWMDDGSDLSTSDKALMKEVYEYLSERDPAWSLGRNHLNFLLKLILENDHFGVDALFILQKLVLVEDVIGIIQNDPNTLLKDVLEKFDDSLETKKAEVTKMLCNCSSHTSGHKLILQENREPHFGKLTCSICVACVLSDIEKLRIPGAALCYNLSLSKLSEDVQLELGSALLNCLNQDMKEETAFHILTALIKFMEGNPEVS